MKEAEHLKRIAFETTLRVHWQCPCCGNTHESDDDETQEGFAKILYEDGVRWKSMKHMQGVICKECYSDPEIRNSSL